MTTRSALQAARAKAFDAFKALADLPSLDAEQETDYSAKKKAVTDLDAQIKRYDEAQALSAATAQPVAGQEKQYASVETDPYVSDDAAQNLAARKGAMPGNAKTLVLGGMIKMAASAHGIRSVAIAEAKDIYGENHPITKALGVSTGTAGGFVVPPDYVAEVIELLRPQAQVRASNPRSVPMPRGTMTLPGQASAATASYGPESGRISASQQTFKQIVATYKKLTALVPVSNDMMRYADPATDQIERRVRDAEGRVRALQNPPKTPFIEDVKLGAAGVVSSVKGWFGESDVQKRAQAYGELESARSALAES